MKPEHKKGRRNRLTRGQIRKASHEFLSARLKRRIELSKQRREEEKAGKDTNELESEHRERERIEREKEEAKRMELKKEMLEKEEKEAERKVEERKERLIRRWKLREIERIAEVEKETEKQNEINRLKEELRKEEESLRLIRETSAAREKELDEERNELKRVKAEAAAKKAERIEAAKKVDDHPYSLSLLYSRNCSICLSSNPRRRAVMITCGHFTCSLCSEQLGDENGQRPFPCPLCRQSTFYVKTFEEEEMRQETLGTRKRKMNGDDDDVGASSVKSPRIADPSCFSVNK
ncbi:hypothetical protein PRIPAC_91420 [Pristionchus pacificus]|uniref:Zinc finger protein n=1 Tax=Pristionchus pacificus TaxID=54126 RepID=A0A2A6CZ30_PRIPA|nr:hypothetical protein PRIPAC_91420 [Pristionchus pacificus]|eukprot:PDM83472.1 zinc finger protein [Pristionchus pacificus]